MSKFIKIIMVCLLSLNMFGCGTDKPEKVVKTMFNSLQAGEMKSFQNCISSSANISFEDIENQEKAFLVKELYSSMKYKIVDVEDVNDNESIVKVDVKMPNLGAAISLLFEEMFSLLLSGELIEYIGDPSKLDAKMLEILSQCLDKVDDDLIEKRVDIKVKKNGDGEYKVDMNFELVDALFLGNIFNSLDDLEELFV